MDTSDVHLNSFFRNIVYHLENGKEYRQGNALWMVGKGEWSGIIEVIRHIRQKKGRKQNFMRQEISETKISS